MMLFKDNGSKTEQRKKVYSRIIEKYGDNYPRFEQFRFDVYLIKINRKNKKQKRILLITDKALYNIKGSSLKRRIGLGKVEKMTVSELSAEFVIHIYEEYDYYFSLENPQRQYLIDNLKASFGELTETKLMVEDVQQASLKDFVITKPEIKKDSKIKERLNETKRREKDIVKGDMENREASDESLTASKTAKLFNTVTKLTTDDFQFLKVLGRGNYGKVMLVRHLQSNKLLAMKILRKAEIHRQNQVEHTKSERNILQAMKHPFLPRLRYAFQTPAKLYLVMDYYAGGELFYHLQHKNHFSEQEVKEISAMILLAIEHLHKFEVIYRDLKPENILLDKDGFIGLADFGLAKCVGEEGRTYTFCGTAAYMSPEQLDGKPIGKSTDWWAFGILIYELITGCAPFYDQDTNKMFNNIKHMPLRFPVWISEPAKRLISGLLSRDPERRLGSSFEGAENIKSADFFDGFNFETVYKKNFKPTYVPSTLNNEEDTVNFDAMFTEEAPIDSFVPEKVGDKSLPFDNFSYYPDEHDDIYGEGVESE